ncbi:GL16420 [Drosophila persimilis]|uniref:GL16420 n=1 Tax=Drosophila persimilis TaxID=7234 RepID=B4GWK0_DROPE|nr:probable serine/threonine-protein kinase mps1 [Drosophila persimilis]EDW27084.1 GL16420 [Drosophila persimilis]
MRNSCVWALLAIIVLWLALATTTTMAETMIEVDENGDEYELKRFFIQGRQLAGDGSKSQCVVTRRKRSSRAVALPQSVSVSSQQLSVEQVPAVEHREGSATIGADLEAGTKRRYVAFTGVHLEPADVEDEDDDEDDDEEDFNEDEDIDQQEQQHPKAQSQSPSQSQFVPAALALPLAQSSASHLPHGVSVVANAASQANVAGDAGIVVVQSHQPPKVNPDTHAVFELKPVKSDVVQAPIHSSAVTTVQGYYPFVGPHWQEYGPDDEDEDEDDYDEDEDDFYYGQGLGGYYRERPGYHPLGEYDEEIITEDSPISTTAVWSTGVDDDDDIHPVINQANTRPNNKNKNKNKKNKNQKNQKNQNKNKRNKNKKQQQMKRKEEQQLAEKEQDLEQNNHDNVDIKEQKQKKKPQHQQQESSLDGNKRPKKKPSSSSSSSSSVSVSTSSSGNTAAVAVISSNGDLGSSQQNKKKKKRPTAASSVNKRKTRPSSQKKKRPSSSSSGSISSSNKRRRPRPSSSSSSSSSSNSVGGYRRRRPQQSLSQQEQLQLQKERRRRQKQKQTRKRQQQQQKRRRQEQQRRRRNRNKNRQFYGDEPIINCIYINKDPPTTTTQRPFWNILGRDTGSNDPTPAPVAGAVAGGAVATDADAVDPVAKQAVLQAVRRNFGDFGGRKRTNLRFVS